MLDRRLPLAILFALLPDGFLSGGYPLRFCGLLSFLMVSYFTLDVIAECMECMSELREQRGQLAALILQLLLAMWLDNVHAFCGQQPL